MPYSIPDLVNWGKICQPLARHGEAKRKGTQGQTLDEDLDMKLYITRKDVEYEYDQDPTSENLFAMGNYFLTLMGIYFFAARQASGSGGSISPLTPDILVPDDIDFIVDGTTLIPTGGSSVYLNGSGGRPDLRGYNVDFARNAMVEYTTNPGNGATYYSWNRVTGLFQLLPFSGGEATAGERFRIMPDTGGYNVTNAPSAQWPIVVNSANFEVDGVTLNDSRIVGNQVMIFVTGFSSEQQFSGTFFDYTSTGIVIIWPEFNAANFGNIIIQKFYS
jgi:hypothetical protein